MVDKVTLFVHNKEERGRKNMKKRVVISALLVVLSLSFVFLSACSSTEEALLGRWETSVEAKDLGTVKMVYHFSEDGQIFLEQKNSDAIPFSIPFGTYSVKKDQLTIVSDGVEKVFQYTVKGKKLTLSYPDEPDLVFTKI